MDSILTGRKVETADVDGFDHSKQAERYVEGLWRTYILPGTTNEPLDNNRTIRNKAQRNVHHHSSGSIHVAADSEWVTI
ncbi:hypothetical protein D6J61_26125 [Salmonella enterica subsp. enterica serovar Alachua]|nr:hypothetical protein [Salmonella enterica subsp. enterica serovar Alachua]